MDTLTKAIMNASADELSLYVFVFFAAMAAGFLTNLIVEHWND